MIVFPEYYSSLFENVFNLRQRIVAIWVRMTLSAK